MPITIVVGGQYGSEGKGKVAHWLAREQGASFAIRVGGPNSGHTVVQDHMRIVLRQLPTAALLGGVVSIIPSGAYIDVHLLLQEISRLGLTKDTVLIHPCAMIIDESMRVEEQRNGLVSRIASTGQGVGIAVSSRVMRHASALFARDIDALKDYICRDLDRVMNAALRRRDRILVEGTQGFGLSLLHGGYYPFATSRDTSAAGALSESGLSPLDVDCVALTLRSFPIRVGGNSGPLPAEITWPHINSRSKANVDLTEYTTVTQRKRRIARFHADIVKSALRANNPNIIALNHVDYFDYSIHEATAISDVAAEAVEAIELEIETKIDYVGSGPSQLILRPGAGWNADRSSRTEMTNLRTSFR